MLLERLFCACWFLSFFSSSLCQGMAAACSCGAPWAFLLTFLRHVQDSQFIHVCLKAFIFVCKVAYFLLSFPTWNNEFPLMS